MDGLVDMVDTDMAEEEMIDSLFYRCDTNSEGEVYVCTVIQFLKNCLGNGNNEPDLITLSHILETHSIDGKVTFQAYRSAVKNWISEIRERCESTAFLEPDGPLHPLNGNNVSNNATDLSLHIENSVDGSSIRVENDIGELLNKVEDLKYMNHKLTEDNLQLNSQIDAQDEQITNLTTDIQNKNKEEEQFKKKLKSLQDLANLTQNVMEENEELKKKLVTAEESKKELDGKVVNLDREKLDLENQFREIENKWQASCNDLELASRETQKLKAVCNEQKAQLVQTLESKTSSEDILSQKNEELDSLKEKLNAFMSQNEKLQEEKEDVQVQLAQMNGKLLSYQSRAEQHGINDTSVEDIVNPVTKKSPKLWFSTPLHRNSICMELKDRLNEDKSLPSPFCEKFELSHDVLGNKQSALLPPYMSAWDLEMSGCSQNDFSAELLKENKEFSPLMYDSMKDPTNTEKRALLPLYMSNWEMSNNTCGDQSTDLLKGRKSLSPVDFHTEATKKLKQLTDRGDSALQKEYLRLYWTNLELAEQCHRSELKETELQDALTEANQRSELDRQKFLHLEESLETSSIARKLDLKDLWRLVHNPEEDDSFETEESISASTELLKKQIQAEIHVLRNKLIRNKKFLKPEKTRQFWYTCRKRRAVSPLVDALDINIVNNTRNQKFFKDTRDSDVHSKRETVDHSVISYNDNIPKCNRSVPLIRRSNAQDRDFAQPVDTDEDISDQELDVDASNCENFESVFSESVDIDKMHGRKDIPARFHSENTVDSERSTLVRLKSGDLNSVDLSFVQSERSNRGRTIDSKNDTPVDHVSRNNDLKDNDNNVERSDTDYLIIESSETDKESNGFRRRSYKKAINNQTDSVEEENVLRSRSHSFQKAIEQGQVSPTSESSVSNSNTDTAETDITPEYEVVSSISMTPAPRYSSTPFTASSAKSVHFQFGSHSSEYNSDSQYGDDRHESYEEDNPQGKKHCKEDEVSSSTHKELLNAENQDSDGKCQRKDDQTSANNESSTEEDSNHSETSSSFQKLASLPMSGSSHPDVRSGSTLDSSPPLEYNCSAEFWSLSPSSGSPEEGEISRDSGHSSSISSLEKTGYPMFSDTEHSVSPDSTDDSKSSTASLPTSSEPVFTRSTTALSNSSEPVFTRSNASLSNTSEPVFTRLTASLITSSEPVFTRSTASSSSTSLPISSQSPSSSEFNQHNSSSSINCSSTSVSSAKISPNSVKGFSQFNKPSVALESQFRKLSAVPESKDEVVRKSRGLLRNGLLHSPKSPGFSKSYQEERSLSPSERILQRSVKRHAEKSCKSKNGISETKSVHMVDVHIRNVNNDCNGVDNVMSDKVGINNVVSDKVGIINVVSDKVGINNVVSDKVGINNAVSDKVGIINVVSDKVGTSNVVSDKVGINNAVSDKVGINNVVSDKVGMHNAVRDIVLTKTEKLVHLPRRKCGVASMEKPVDTIPISNHSPSRKGLTLKLNDASETNDATNPTTTEQPPPAISFYQAVVKEMKTSDDAPTQTHNGIKPNSNGAPLLIQGEKAHSPVGSTNQATTSNLSKIRESHLAKRRDHLRPITMPQLSELSEKETSENNNEEKQPETLNPKKEDVVPAPVTNGDVIMPSIPDKFLCKLGLTPEGKSSEELSDQEIESKFTSLSLAFKTDSQTLEKRLEIQERSRDIAEQNVDKELQGLRSGLETLNQICTDPQVREVLNKIQNHIDILEKSTARVSSRAEVFGAIQQEKRMSKAVDIMVHHVENIRRVHEREHAELEEARKLLQDSRSLAPSSIDLAGGGEALSRRSASVCQNNMFSTKQLSPLGTPSSPLTPTAVKAIKLLKASRRRVSEIALPKVLGGSGAATLHPSASMDSFYTEPRSPRFNLSAAPFRVETSPMLRSESILDEEEGSNLNTAHLDHSSLHPNNDPDARSRLQAVIASTAMKSAVANTIRRASLEKQGNVQSVSPACTPPQVSRDNSSESSNKQAAVVEAVQDKEKQKNMEEDAFKKGYEQGLRASLGQDLSSLREQQNHINESLGDIMDSIDNQTEEPKSLKEILVERFHENIPKFTISGWRIRMTFGCFFIVMAIISVILALCPVNMGHAVTLHHFGKPPV